MKKIFLFAIVMSISGIFAQKDFQGMAVYESKTSTADMMKGMSANREMTPEMTKMIEERMKKMFEKTFILNFNKTASIYKEEEKLEAGASSGGGRFMTSMMGGGGTYYKNVKDKLYTVDKETLGKEFLIVDSLPTLKWDLSSAETKKIGDYTCFKATAMKPVSKSDFSSMRPKQKKEEEKKDETKKAEEKKTNFLDSMEMPKEILVTAWYCPEVPINQGPGQYWGLPGLIMEVNDGRTIVLCSKIAMNIKEKAEIKAPNNGSKVTQKEYDDIVVKKMEEFRENNGNGGRQGGFQMRTR
jgi:GLPGLI family protein